MGLPKHCICQSPSVTLILNGAAVCHVTAASFRQGIWDIHSHDWWGTTCRTPNDHTLITYPVDRPYMFSVEQPHLIDLNVRQYAVSSQAPSSGDIASSQYESMPISSISEKL